MKPCQICRLQLFHMKYQTNNEVPLAEPRQKLRSLGKTGLDPVSDLIIRCRNSVFGHIAGIR